LMARKQGARTMSKWGKGGRLASLGCCGLLLVLLTGCGQKSNEILNVSYDPTRELWRDLNEEFLKDYEKKTGVKWSINMSHGGSASQARSIIDGIDADVATLALWQDTDALRKKGLLKDGWDERLPHKSLPWLSTIVFVVRKGNPRNIKDWSDLLRDDMQIITPNPKTSGNGKLSFLAAWGQVIDKGGSEAEAREFVTRLYQRVPVLDAGARGSTTTFAQKKIGDVHLTWENEAYLEVEEAKGELTIVYPKASIRAEPPVAVVDANVDRRGTRATAEAYLLFLYTPEAQRIIGKHRYRPIDEKIQAEFTKDLPPIRLFPVTVLAKNWAETESKFFAEKAIFDSIYLPSNK